MQKLYEQVKLNVVRLDFDDIVTGSPESEGPRVNVGASRWGAFDTPYDGN